MADARPRDHWSQKINEILEEMYNKGYFKNYVKQVRILN